ncbi:cytidylate kinase : Cytidylate kinase OS=Ethanoligenens harbinense (strain DSM 18485 / JCM 12961 / CGMCC 1.5033 / YUAN-3) GN=cmk PE=3 SV=1: ADK: Cytidylate_kin [Gemmataceae bacterium]|nr:cytidylate kinase : Cytidylate kinase OS=Ethanoligenens harbinense (strain DSM 18485 / JCM 12961 / CGMCC 1.5033 / YUAN-3) GN=cmk PE=3 SV=1: ADK: Cytidylate_kin [Gemmataceae bacterium]VTT97117.1 cytidylate kinase : Cytidylate kinase OS=Ethanoligenens harbinense (strain DSM 18485 / JCM 12961 / CGMCC 1.5033 / YUAN-3) GN=cmk PE=3 SV=1: ADK: Cytidylate_kin [Gemmataceae bacterium]
MIVTIDGPAASGKGTVARGIADRLGFAYLDTGAMYRAVALAALRAGADCSDAAAVERLLPDVHIEMPPDRVLLNGGDVTEAIRAPEVSQGASRVAAVPSVRAFLVPQQRRIGAGRDMVSEGRDQGTVVFPDAAVKFYVTADPRVRAERRHLELVRRGVATTVERELAELLERDRRDSDRADGPLRRPPDAHLIDTSHRTVEAVLDEMEGVVRRCTTDRA